MQNGSDIVQAEIGGLDEIPMGESGEFTVVYASAETLGAPKKMLASTWTQKSIISISAQSEPTPDRPNPLAWQITSLKAALRAAELKIRKIRRENSSLLNLNLIANQEKENLYEEFLTERKEFGLKIQYHTN